VAFSAFSKLLSTALAAALFAASPTDSQARSRTRARLEAAAAKIPFYELSDAQLAVALKKIHDKHDSFAARVFAISARFKGTPYKFSPLGEGKGAKYDPDPIFSVHKVDCLTFLEQVLALAHTPDLARAKRLLQHIRYDAGKIDFARRHHFAESQWLPASQKLGIVVEATRDAGGDTVVTAKTRAPRSIYRGKWASWKKQLGGRLPTGTFELPMLPLDDALRLSEKFEAGTIVTVLRVPDERMPTRVTHQGLVVVKNGRRYLRHASGPPFKRVVDFPLKKYFQFCKRYFKNRWPVAGVNVQRIVESKELLALD